jgi:hypothetical protein
VSKGAHFWIGIAAICFAVAATALNLWLGQFWWAALSTLSAVILSVALIVGQWATR